MTNKRDDLPDDIKENISLAFMTLLRSDKNALPNDLQIILTEFIDNLIDWGRINITNFDSICLSDNISRITGKRFTAAYIESYFFENMYGMHYEENSQARTAGALEYAE